MDYLSLIPYIFYFQFLILVGILALLFCDDIKFFRRRKDNINKDGVKNNADIN